MYIAKSARRANKANSRAKLTVSEAISIFAKRRSVPAFFIAGEYGVSEKAIRDIWTGRTWSKETWPLEPSRVMQIKRLGRPKGSKDLRPRKKRSTLLETQIELIDGLNLLRGAVQCALAHNSDLQPGNQSSSQATSVPGDPVRFDSQLITAGERDSNHKRFPAKRSPESLDEQLHAWEEWIWYDPQQLDPF